MMTERRPMIRPLPLLLFLSFLFSALMIAGCRSPGPAENADTETARSSHRGTGHRTFRSEREVTIERPDFKETKVPPKKTSTAAAAGKKEPAAPETTETKSAAAAEKDVAAAPEPGETAGVPVSSKPAPKSSTTAKTEKKPASAETGGGASDWEAAFIADMQGVIDAKKARSNLSGDDLAEHFPVADEIQIGEAVAARILSKTPELVNHDLWEYVNFVGISLAEQSRRNELPYRFVVLDAPKEINAFAAPGGFVFITSGAIRFCRNEAELAAILAHEIGHVSLRHGLRALDRGKYRVLAESAVAEMDAARTNVFGEDSRPERLRKMEAELSGIADDCYEQTQAPYNRTLEDEADQESLRLLSAAGYNPFAAVRLLERLASMKKKEPAFTRALRSHPAPSERAVVLQKAARKMGIRDEGALCEERFLRYRAGLD